MQRDIDRLKTERFDVLVIGGGIYGSWIAYQAAVTGLKVALVEKSDWGSATSASSSKLLHGGLRYLERFEVGLVRKSLHERRELNRLLPHHVRPLRFLLPVYSHSRVGRFRLKLGLWLYDRLAGKNQPVSGHQCFSANAMLKQEPALKNDKLLGGFSYGDCGTDDARVILEVVDSAITAGAAACHYVKAEQLLVTDGRVTGAKLSDCETGDTFDVNASIVVNASGPWVNRQLDISPKPTAAADDSIRLTKGVHLVLPAMESGHAVLLTARSDGRVFFLIPWYGRTLLGTTDTDFHGDPATVAVEPADIDYLLSAANDYLHTPWTTDDVLGTFAGLRTLKNETGKSASGVSREWAFEELSPGMMTSIGGKYTSARVDAIAAVEKVRKALRLPSLKDSVSDQMAWCPASPFPEWLQQTREAAVAVGIDRETATTCARRYGTHMTDIIARVKASPELGPRIVPDLPFCRAEILHAVEYEMARTLMDIVRRRIPLLILTRLRQETLDEICGFVAPVLHWDTARQEQEVASVLERLDL
jgi:glycerol-3-phosphate dehydrogenase